MKNRFVKTVNTRKLSCFISECKTVTFLNPGIVIFFSQLFLSSLYCILKCLCPVLYPKLPKMGVWGSWEYVSGEDFFLKEIYHE